MPTAPSQPTAVLRDQALELMLSERGMATVPVAVGDTSMVPLLRGGDAVLAVPLAAPPRPGDLLLYRQEDYWVVHRCLGPAGTVHGLRTRGDGRNTLDPRVEPADVRARVSAVRRRGSWRSLEGGPARAFARLMAWHDLSWAAAGVVARKAGLGSATAAFDRGVLRLFVPIVFPLLHRRIAPPTASGSESAV